MRFHYDIALCLEIISLDSESFIRLNFQGRRHLSLGRRHLGRRHLDFSLDIFSYRLRPNNNIRLN